MPIVDRAALASLVVGRAALASLVVGRVALVLNNLATASLLDVSSLVDNLAIAS